MSDKLPEGLDAGLVVTGERGTMTVINPVAPHMGHELILETADGNNSEDVAGETTYAHQLRHIIDVLHGKSEPLTGGSDAIATMRVLDDVYRLAGMRPD
jgi:hypothetical protein